MLQILPIIPSRISQKKFLLFFILVCCLLFLNYARLVFAASNLVFKMQRSDCSIRVFERSIRVYRSFSQHSFNYASYIIFLVVQLFLLANQGEARSSIPPIIPVGVRLFYYACNRPIIPELFSRNWLPIIPKIMPA